MKQKVVNFSHPLSKVADRNRESLVLGCTVFFCFSVFLFD